MTALQKYCATCGKATKNTGSWRYSPIYCIQCQIKEENDNKKRLKTDHIYAKQQDLLGKVGTIMFFITISAPFILYFFILSAAKK